MVFTRPVKKLPGMQLHIADCFPKVTDFFFFLLFLKLSLGQCRMLDLRI